MNETAIKRIKGLLIEGTNPIQEAVCLGLLDGAAQYNSGVGWNDPVMNMLYDAAVTVGERLAG